MVIWDWGRGKEFYRFMIIALFARELYGRALLLGTGIPECQDDDDKFFSACDTHFNFAIPGNT